MNYIIKGCVCNGIHKYYGILIQDENGIQYVTTGKLNIKYTLKRSKNFILLNTIPNYNDIISDFNKNFNNDMLIVDNNKIKTIKYDIPLSIFRIICIKNKQHQLLDRKLTIDVIPELIVYYKDSKILKLDIKLSNPSINITYNRDNIFKLEEDSNKQLCFNIFYNDKRKMFIEYINNFKDLSVYADSGFHIRQNTIYMIDHYKRINNTIYFSKYIIENNEVYLHGELVYVTNSMLETIQYIIMHMELISKYYYKKDIEMLTSIHNKYVLVKL